MQYDYLLIRYGEMVLKGHNRRDFINRLLRNVKMALHQHGNFDYDCQHDRLFVRFGETDYRKLIPVLGTVFGISSFSFAVKTRNNIEEIVQASYCLSQNHQGATFKVIARRNDKRFPVTSDQINRLVAGRILQNTDLRVDVHNPELKLLIEVRADGTYIMDNKHFGAQGFPAGSGERALLLLSGGIDSPVAGYLALKKGLVIECLHFESSPYTSVLALNKVRDLVKKLALYQSRVILHIAPFTEIQLAINQEIPESYRITIMRRMMLRLACTLAQKRHCLGIISGESIGQVASQTLTSIKVISEVAQLPIIRPLVSYDKLEIVELAKRIATYEISSLPYEDCCTVFTPQNPATKPKSERAVTFENRLAYDELLEKCLATTTTEVFDSLVDEQI